MSRVVRTVAVTACALLLCSSAGCGLFHRAPAGPSNPPTTSPSSSASATASTAADAALAETVRRSRAAGGANVLATMMLTSGPVTQFSGLVDLNTGRGQGDYTAASGRVVQRVIIGGKTYTSTGTGWIATPTAGRGLTGGDLPALWRVLSSAQFTRTGSTFTGRIPVADAIALAGIDLSTTPGLDTQDGSATLTLIADATGVASSVTVTAVFPASQVRLRVALGIRDVGQVVDVTAPTVAVTGGPEGQ